MRTPKSILIGVIVLILGSVSVYSWQKFRAPEFYPVLQKRCLEPLPYDKSLSGRLILIPQDTEGYRLLADMFSTGNMVYDLKTRVMIPVDEQNMTGNFASSPDGKQLAYQQINIEAGQERHYLIIRSHKGSETRIPLETGQSFVYWLDNRKALLQKRQSEKLIEEIIILNLDKTETQRITPVYPNWDNTWSIVGYYSPDLTRVLYPDNTEYIDPTYVDIGYSYVDSSYGDFILYDEKHRKSLLRIEQAHKLDEVVWKQDSSGFFLASNNVPIGKDLDWASAEMRFLDRNGIVKWKIDFANVDFGFRYSLASRLLLSPDQQLLSVEVGTAFFDSRRLFIDVSTGNIFDYCLKSDYLGVWSPDSRYIALASVNSNDRITTIIIDIRNQKIYKIMDGYIPVGWLVDD